MNNEISNTQDILDSRDIIARIEELEDMERDEQENEEFELLTDFMGALQGMGGDEQWRGEWYPVTIIRDSYFEEYAKELAEDCGMIDDDATWPKNCIDWEQAASELQQDYSSIDFDGETYWTR
jgi:hypothetical protein